ncbi:hypothetical protein HHI36_018444 [Cryptolaemus montrouzieri]|uniref:Uncharacterized protein n=1 Tax=Cryptolaemus montrouzieri TaxID=559131 RepID=A0ABD2P0C6_9CUCU
MTDQLMAHSNDSNTSENHLEIIQNPVNIANERVVNLSNAVVSIDNSRDVVIGNAFHHYHGPVTLQQIAPSIPQAIVTNSNELSPSSVEHLVSEDKLQTKNKVPFSRKNAILCATLICSSFVLLVISLLLYLPNSKNHINGTDKPKIELNGTTSSSFGESGFNQCQVIEEEEWGIKRNLEDIILKHPVPLVIISHSDTPFCNNFQKCQSRIAQIQEYHLSLGSPDIGYNFIIGGDGRIYVGRGWNARNFHIGNHSIGLNFIGNYFRDELSPKMIECAKAILNYGVESGKLTQDYILVAHNQTKLRGGGTLSPGPNIYREIKKWPHFFGDRLDWNFLYGVKGLCSKSENNSQFKCEDS